MVELPVYLDNGEHPEGRERVGVCKIEIVDGGVPKLSGDIHFDEAHEWLGGLVGTMETSFGHDATSGCFLLKPPKDLDERLA